IGGTLTYKKKVALPPPKEESPIPSIAVVKPKAHRLTVKAPPLVKAKAKVQTAAPPSPSGNFRKERFYFTSWFNPKGTQEGGGELDAPMKQDNNRHCFLKYCLSQMAKNSLFILEHVLQRTNLNGKTNRLIWNFGTH
ncbi:hypothetical protein EJ110_NYTH08493, partial [Nymphaea thermarum]